jgi:hypothetical protein
MRITAACGNCQRDLLLSQLVEGPVLAGRCPRCGASCSAQRRRCTASAGVEPPRKQAAVPAHPSRRTRGPAGPQSAAATTAALELLGSRVGRLTLVAVTDLDDSYAGREERSRLQGVLEQQAEAVRAWLREQDGPVQAKQTVVPELKLMAGRPAATLDTQGLGAV